MRKLLDPYAQCTRIPKFVNEIDDGKLKDDLLMVGDMVMQLQKAYM